MTTALAILSDGSVRRGLTPESTEQAFREQRPIVWVDMDDPPNPDEQTFLRNIFGISDSAIGHLTEPHFGPRAARFRSHALVVIFEVCFEPDDHSINRNELVLVVGERFVLSLHSDPNTQLKAVAEQIEQHIQRFDARTGAVVFAILDAVSDQYLRTVREVRHRVDALELRVMQYKESEAIPEIYELGTELTLLRRVIAPEESLFSSLLISGTAGSDEENNDALLDIEHDMRSAVEEIDQYQSKLPRILTTFESMKSDNLNRVVQLLTVWSIILTAAALFPTVLGISLAREPNLSPLIGYGASVGVMIGIGLLVWFVLKRRGWMM